MFFLPIKLIFLAVFLFATVSADAQNYYATRLFDRIEHDTTAHRLELEEGLLAEQAESYLDRLIPCAKSVAKETLIRHAILDVIDGYERGIQDFLENDIAQAVLYDCQMDGNELLDITRDIRQLRDDYAKVSGMYEYLAMRPKYTKLLESYKAPIKYDLNDGQSILEIGAGDLRFAEIATRNLFNVKYYLNEIDPYALKRMYTGTRKIDVFNRSDNSFYIIQGSDTNTGAEKLIFDKIIIRSALHHFSDKQAMIQSIKKSMNDCTELIIVESYSDDEKGASKCSAIMTEVKFESLLQSSGFTLYKKRKVIRRNKRRWLTIWKLQA